MRIYQSIIGSLVVVFSLTTGVHATTAAPVLTAKGVAIYGWKDGAATAIFVKNEHTLYPIASLTKLITAKVAQDLYPATKLFTISKAAAATYGVTYGVTIGSQFSRDDLLKALLVNSSNDAAAALMEAAGTKTFLTKMNDILHTNKYTTTSFVNPSGLDPVKKTIKSNRMTPYHVTRLLNDIYQGDPLLADIMAKDVVEITNLKTNTTTVLKQTNNLYRDELYKDKVLMSKTGLTNLAGQNLAFITPGNDVYDYVSIVILGSKSRTVDSKKVLDWLDMTNQNFGG